MSARRAGFTLIELLVAIAVSAVIALIAWNGISTALLARERVLAEERGLRELQRFFSLIATDLRQFAGRGVLDENGLPEPALQLVEDGEWRLDLTRWGWSNPTGAPRANLQRVRWRLAEGVLLRGYWPVLDRAAPLPIAESAVLSGVRALRLRTPQAGADGQALLWRDGLGTAGETHEAFQITVELEGIGTVQRVLSPAGGTP